MKRLLFLLPLLLITSCENERYKNPLEYCYLKLCEKYDYQVPYSYKEINGDYILSSKFKNNNSIKTIYNYEITCYGEEKMDIWICEAAFSCVSQVYLSSQCVDVICKWVYSVSY